MAKIDVNKINSWPNLRAAFRKLLSTYDTEYFGGYSGTYKEIKKLRDNGSLIPGNKYRIIDYETVIGDIDYDSYSGYSLDGVFVDSAKHPFDLILTANTKNEFSHNAEATHSARDTEGYFADRDLSKWQIWYDINNDHEKYHWVDNSCKGAIYRMINENNVDCPYDFENITFNGKYTFSTIIDESLGAVNNTNVYNCTIKPWLASGKQQKLNNNVIVVTTQKYTKIENIYLDYNCNNNNIFINERTYFKQIRLGVGCQYNKIAADVTQDAFAVLVNVVLGSYCIENIIQCCNIIRLGDACVSVKIQGFNAGYDNTSIIIGNSCNTINLTDTMEIYIDNSCSNIALTEKYHVKFIGKFIATPATVNNYSMYTALTLVDTTSNP